MGGVGRGSWVRGSVVVRRASLLAPVGTSIARRTIGGGGNSLGWTNVAPMSGLPEGSRGAGSEGNGSEISLGPRPRRRQGRQRALDESGPKAEGSGRGQRVPSDSRGQGSQKPSDEAPNRISQTRPCGTGAGLSDQRTKCGTIPIPFLPPTHRGPKPLYHSPNAAWCDRPSPSHSLAPAFQGRNGLTITSQPSQGPTPAGTGVTRARSLS
jgi:hypothetical protein